MNEKQAAIKIQNWYRKIIIKKRVVDEAKRQFEELSEEIGDLKPTWNSNYFCLPHIEMSKEVERNFIESNIIFQE